MASRPLRVIPKKEEVRLETEGEAKGREAEARPEDDKIGEVRREEVESSRTPLATQATIPDNDTIVTRAVDVIGSVVIVVIPFL